MTLHLAADTVIIPDIFGETQRNDGHICLLGGSHGSRRVRAERSRRAQGGDAAHAVRPADGAQGAAGGEHVICFVGCPPQCDDAPRQVFRVGG